MFTDVSGSRADAENIAVLVTDRLPARRERVIRREADITKAKGIKIMTVCICEQVHLLKFCFLK